MESSAISLKIIQDNLNTDNQVDLLVTDIEMPELSGLVHYKKAIELDSKIPIILMTAYGT